MALNTNAIVESGDGRFTFSVNTANHTGTHTKNLSDGIIPTHGGQIGIGLNVIFLEEGCFFFFIEKNVFGYNGMFQNIELETFDVDDAYVNGRIIP